MLASLAPQFQAVLLTTVKAVAQHYPNLSLFLLLDDTECDPALTPPLPADNAPTVIEDYLADHPFADALTEIEALLLDANAPPIQGLAGRDTFTQAALPQQVLWLTGQHGVRHLLSLQALRRHAMACASPHSEAEEPAVATVSTSWLTSLPLCHMALGDPPTSADNAECLPLYTLGLGPLALPKVLQTLNIV